MATGVIVWSGFAWFMIKMCEKRSEPGFYPYYIEDRSYGPVSSFKKSESDHTLEVDDTSVKRE